MKGRSKEAKEEFVMATLNVTSRATWLEVLPLVPSSIAVLSIQEHKCDQEQLDSFGSKAELYGWHVFGTPAACTEAGGVSAGVALM